MKENEEEKISEENQEISKKSLKIKCPYCYEDNYPASENNPFKAETKLSCNKCKKDFYFLKCFHCKGHIYYKQEMDFTNFIIKCPYIKCQKIFSISYCNLCNTKIYFSGRYPVKCPNKSCNNVFFKIKCPMKECNNFIIINFKNSNNNNIYKEGDLILCELHDTKFLF